MRRDAMNEAHILRAGHKAHNWNGVGDGAPVRGHIKAGSGLGSTSTEPQRDTMKLAVLLVVVCLVGLGAGKSTPRPAKACLKQCGSDYTPVCAGDGKDKPKSFGTVCVMDNYNCEHGASLKKISDGECPGGGGVRLS